MRATTLLTLPDYCQYTEDCIYTTSALINHTYGYQLTRCTINRLLSEHWSLKMIWSADHVTEWHWLTEAKQKYLHLNVIKLVAPVNIVCIELENTHIALLSKLKQLHIHCLPKILWKFSCFQLPSEFWLNICHGIFGAETFVLCLRFRV